MMCRLGGCATPPTSSPISAVRDHPLSRGLRNARRQLGRALAWWDKHRAAAPALLLDEVTEALDLLATSPRAGIPYVYRGRAAGVRRVLPPHARYHVYYTIDEDARTVTVRVLWHATRRDPSAI
jgi:plasmid stabilization system protein ParE